MTRTWIKACSLSVLIGVICFVSRVEAVETGTSADNGTPVIQFETNFFDFGKLIAPGSVSGVFKFKNAGTGLLEIGPPEPSCGCTVAKVQPDKLAPGQSGEITYTISLDHDMGQVQKQITVHSNDPKTPALDLTIQLDYTPLYEINPMLMRLVLPTDKDEAQGNFMVVRNDGKPLGIEKIVTSQKGVSAALAPSYTPDASSAQINVTVHRPTKPLSVMLANVQVWATNQDQPVQTLFLSCQILGELKANPSRVYWVIPDFGNSITNYPPESLTRKVELDSIADKPVQIGNVSTTIKGMSVEVAPKVGKVFNLILKFSELPQQFTSGNITIDTLSPYLPKLTVPVVVSVAPK